MKKIMFTLIIANTLCSCGMASKVAKGNDYRIVKIDSIENTYLIYAEKTDVSIKNSSMVKIVSAKSRLNCKKNNSIIVDKTYMLNIYSLYPQNMVSHNLKSIMYNGTLIPIDKDYNVKKDLFASENIKGLCYKNK